ncbi:DMT family transporter [Alicyclobacillus fructus]|uniref:DMT family transporter n=1 Tax=Alicyclobacillus fructus TaxID=2816082 RepID=UPI001A90C171|nr:multidrug efflux SMR transporter [Alicyclobacillus fructus]
MISYLFLGIAIVSEVFATSMLKATAGFTKLLPSIGVVLGYGIAFYAMSLVLKDLPLSVSYAIWSGAGTAFTALIGLVVWKQPLNIPIVIGILLIIVGVVILNLNKTA